MIRNCNGSDITLPGQRPGSACACGLSFDDQERMVFYPHPELAKFVNKERELNEILATADYPEEINETNKPLDLENLNELVTAIKAAQDGLHAEVESTTDELIAVDAPASEIVYDADTAGVTDSDEITG